MTAVPLQLLARRLRQSAGGTHPDDVELMDRVAKNDSAAFEALVLRHGSAVRAACRKVAGDGPDADDAFQAAFLLLWRNAARLSRPSVRGWLTVVAHRAALRARMTTARRQQIERRACGPMTEFPDPSWREASVTLHEELDRLPEKYRGPLLLCYFDGLSRDEAARSLGWSENAVKWRLERGRQLLKNRLTRRGLALSAGLLGTLAGSADGAELPARLLEATVESAATGRASIGVSSLLKATSPGVSKVKLVAAAVLLAGLFAGMVAGQRPRSANGQPVPQPPPAQPAKADGAIHGRILDPDGQPLPGAKIFLAAFDQETKNTPLAVADAEGRFRVELPSRADASYGQTIRWLVATADGFAVNWVNADQLGETPEITLKLAKDLPLTGRLRDLEGRPVKGARVTVQALETTPNGDLTPVLEQMVKDAKTALRMAGKGISQVDFPGWPRPATTDADGRFTITGVGRERIAVLRLEGETTETQTVRVAAREGFAKDKPVTGPAMVQTRADRVDRKVERLYGPDFSVTLGPTKPIFGRITQAGTDAPLAGIGVTGYANDFRDNSVHAKTEAQGRYKLTGLRKAPSYQLMFGAGPDRPLIAAMTTVSDTEGLVPLAADFQMIVGVVLTGRVTDQVTGKPVSGQLAYEPLVDNKYFSKIPGVDFYRMGVTRYHIDKDGRFRLVALPGSGVVHVTARDEQNYYTMAKLDPADQDKVFERDGGMGTVFLTAGQRIESISYSNAYKLIDPKPDAGTLELNFALDRGLTKKGRLVGPDGQPLMGVLFGAKRALRGQAEKLPGDTFVAEALDPEVPRTLVFLHPEKKLAGSLRLRGDEPGEPVVRLQPCSTVRGRLLDIDGQPIADADVKLHFKDDGAMAVLTRLQPTAPSTRTDAEGRFERPGLLPGLKFDVVFTAGSRRRLYVGDVGRDLTLTAGQTKDVGDVRVKKRDGE
ncbi:MAG: sigma-70 family RNA polymerase sigma factor [Gemmataceae bacterium]